MFLVFDFLCFTQFILYKVAKKDKLAVNARKKQIQDRFKKEMGLIVDVPKQGFGTSNDGNTARRFFSNPRLAAAITGIDEDIIGRFRTILISINSDYTINAEKFRAYCLATADKYILLYSWYYMPTSVHKILIHGTSVINHFLLPIGELSEAAQESKMKDIRKYREHYTRKYNREKTNEDLLHRLILSSDPYLSAIRYLIQYNAAALYITI